MTQFGDLPLEIRTEIFRFALLYTPLSDEPPFSNNSQLAELAELLLTCKQFWVEGSHLLFENKAHVLISL